MGILIFLCQETPKEIVFWDNMLKDFWTGRLNLYEVCVIIGLIFLQNLIAYGEKRNEINNTISNNKTTA
jgi:hypothetical protein